jgi:PAS domain S-box-containing protein
MTKSLRNTSREDLIAEIERLQAELRQAKDSGSLIHELTVHQEEIEVQTAQLIDTQHALEESRDRYVDLYDFAPVGYMTLDANGSILEINLTGARLLGKDRSKVLGIPFVNNVHVSDRLKVHDFLRRCKEDVGTVTVELTLGAAADNRIVELLTRRFEAQSAPHSSYVTVMNDVTAVRTLERERKVAEQARVQLEKEQAVARASSEAKDHFLAALSHELRTPLTPVLAALSDSHLWSSLPEPQRSAVDLMRRNLDVEIHLIDDLLDVTRIARNRLMLRRQSVDLHDAIRDVATMSGHAALLRNVTIVQQLQAGDTWVMGDPTRLRQVLWNLLSNAIKFSRPGGVVTLASANDGPGHVVVRVTDTGAGMDARMLAGLFEKPESALPPQTQAAGLGLGLVICHGVVTAHGGTIRAFSEGIGQGSTFEVRLRTSPPPLEASAPPVSVSTGNTTSLRVLLVEDHSDTAEMLSMLLRHHGFKVAVAGSVDAALDLARAGCDVLVSDVRLPDGTGMDLLRRLREISFVRGIAMSGFGTQDDVRRSKEAGYDEHLVKPIDVQRLIEAIHKVAEGIH